MTAYIENGFLVFVRLLALLMTGPLVGHRSLPVAARIALAGALTMLVLSTRGALRPLGVSDWGYLVLVGREVFIGAGIGFAAALAFAGLQMAGGVVGSSLGLQTGQLLDPVNGQPSLVMDQFYALLAGLLFLSLDGHHWFLRAAWQTFEAVPPGTLVLPGLAAQSLTDLMGVVLSTALQIALPALSTVLLADLVLGITNRALPQVNVFFLGLPLKVGLGLVALALTLPLAGPPMVALLRQGVQAAGTLWSAAP